MFKFYFSNFWHNIFHNVKIASSGEIYFSDFTVWFPFKDKENFTYWRLQSLAKEF